MTPLTRSQITSDKIVNYFLLAGIWCGVGGVSRKKRFLLIHTTMTHFLTLSRSSFSLCCTHKFLRKPSSSSSSSSSSARYNLYANARKKTEGIFMNLLPTHKVLLFFRNFHLSPPFLSSCTHLVNVKIINSTKRWVNFWREGEKSIIFVNFPFFLLFAFFFIGTVRKTNFNFNFLFAGHKNCLQFSRVHFPLIHP